MLLRSLPVKDPASLAVVSTRNTGFQYSMSYPAYTYLRDHASSLDGVVAFRAQPLNVSAGRATERVTGMLVSGNYFDVLGVGMAAGSPIGADDDRVPGSGGARGLVAVLSHQYWKRRFSADAGGRRVVRCGSTGIPSRSSAWRRRASTARASGSLPDVFVPMMFAAPRVRRPELAVQPAEQLAAHHGPARSRTPAVSRRPRPR